MLAAGRKRESGISVRMRTENASEPVIPAW
jgi:hypothetical protein